MTVLRYYTIYKTYTEIEILKEWYVSQDLLNTTPPKYRYHGTLKLVEAPTALPTSRFHISLLKEPGRCRRQTYNHHCESPSTEAGKHTQEKQGWRQLSCNPLPGEEGSSCAERTKSSSPKTAFRAARDPRTPSSSWGPAHSCPWAPRNILYFSFVIWASRHIETSRCPLAAQQQAAPSAAWPPAGNILKDFIGEPWSCYTSTHPFPPGFFPLPLHHSLHTLFVTGINQLKLVSATSIHPSASGHSIRNTPSNTSHLHLGPLSCIAKRVLRI